MLSKSKKGDLDCFLNANVFNNIVSDMIREQIHPLCFNLLESCFKLVFTLVDRCPDVCTTRQAALAPLFQQEACKIISDLHRTTKQRLEERLQVEKIPFTKNHHLYKTIAKRRNEVLQRRLLRVAQALPNDRVAFIAVVMTAFAECTLRSCEEHASAELHTILEAYGKVACKRIIDDIPMLITTTLVAPLALRLRSAAHPTDIDLQKILAETDEVAAARRRATDQLRAMETAEAACDSFLKRGFQ
jgi:hypothetical protein